MNKIKVILTKFPQWTFTFLTVLLILWLTLAPDPLGDESPTLFPGADKIVHGIMFGFLTVMLLLDKSRKDGWRKVSTPFIIVSAAASSALGIMIEFMQREMEMGRGFETADMIADCMGAALCAAGWFASQHYWCYKD